MWMMAITRPLPAAPELLLASKDWNTWWMMRPCTEDSTRLQGLMCRIRLEMWVKHWIKQQWFKAWYGSNPNVYEHICKDLLTTKIAEACIQPCTGGWFWSLFDGGLHFFSKGYPIEQHWYGIGHQDLWENYLCMDMVLCLEDFGSQTEKVSFATSHHFLPRWWSLTHLVLLLCIPCACLRQSVDGQTSCRLFLGSFFFTFQGESVRSEDLVEGAPLLCYWLTWGACLPWSFLSMLVCVVAVEALL